jgi:hypothetical protein
MEISYRILSRVKKHIEDAITRKVEPITPEKALELLSGQRQKLMNFREN